MARPRKYIKIEIVRDFYEEGYEVYINGNRAFDVEDEILRILSEYIEKELPLRRR